MRSRTTYSLAVAVGGAAASFGFLALVVVGLALGASLAGLAGGLIVAAVLSVGWLFCVRWAWRRLPRPTGPRD